MWDENYDLPGACTPESNAAFCARLGKNCGAVTDADNCGTTRTVSSCGSCLAPEICGGDGTPNVCAAPSTSYEGGGRRPTPSGVVPCPPPAPRPSPSSATAPAGRRPRAPARAGTRCASWATTARITSPSTTSTRRRREPIRSRSTPTAAVAPHFLISVNGGSCQDRSGSQSPGWYAQVAVDTTVTLKAGSNSIRFYNNNAWAPDLDRIVVPGESARRLRRRRRRRRPAGPAPSPSARTVYDGPRLVGHHHLQEHGHHLRVVLQGRVRHPPGAHCTNDAVPVGRQALAPHRQRLLGLHHLEPLRVHLDQHAARRGRFADLQLLDRHARASAPPATSRPASPPANESVAM